MRPQLKTVIQIGFSIIAVIFLASFISNVTSQTKNETIEINDNNFFDPNIDDEISPYCEGVKFQDYKNLTFDQINSLDIEIFDKNSWFENIFNLSFGSEGVIDEQYKDKYDSQIVINYKNNVQCSFLAEIRISGDFKDHLDKKDLMASMDVKLLEGNISEITKFKLFLPETRKSDNEIVTTTILEQLGFLSPRTAYVNVRMLNSNSKYQEKKFIFQEKFSKEMVEYYNFREGPLLEANESFFWDSVINEKVDFQNEFPLIIAKDLNKYWSRSNNISALITIEALEKFNKAIFNSYDSFIHVNYSYMGDNKLLFYNFDAALVALLADHAMMTHQLKFFYNKIEDQFYPIYYDGNSEFLISDSIAWRTDYQELNNLYEGANSLYLNLDINKKDFHEKLLEKGLDISSEISDSYIERFKKNLLRIQSEQKEKEPNYQDFFQNNKKISYPEEFSYAFYDPESEIFEICNWNLSICENHKQKIDFEELFSKKVISLDTKSYLLGKSKKSFLYETKTSDRSYISINEGVKVRLIGDPYFDINRDEKSITIKISKANQRVIFVGPGFLNNWEINVLGNRKLEQSQNRYDENLLTGCLTLYKIEVENLKLSLENLHCEDALNIMNTTGQINSIEIINSASDALDLDFSKLNIDKIEILNSKNDCIDMSSGDYFIELIKVENCEDKGISVGEGSFFSANKVDLINTFIGIAVKDSSEAEVKKLNVKNSKICLSAYRKKQEFGPSKIHTQEFTCLGDSYNFIQEGSDFTNG